MTQAIMLAVLFNTCVKEGIIVFTGSSGLRWSSLPGFVVMLVVGIITAFYM